MNELKSYIRNMNLDVETYARLIRILISLRQRRDEIRNAIADRYTQYAQRITRRYHHANMDDSDFFQEAYEALLRAVDSYDPTYGVPFEAYAFLWIRKSLSHLVETSCDLIRIPDSVIKNNRKLGKPTNPCQYEVYKDIQHSGEPTAEEVLICKKTREYLNACISNLDDTRRKILQKRYFTDKANPHSLEKVAKECGLSRERTRLLEQDALRTIEKKLKNSKAISSRQTTH